MKEKKSQQKYSVPLGYSKYLQPLCNNTKCLGKKLKFITARGIRTLISLLQLCSGWMEYFYWDRVKDGGKGRYHAQGNKNWFFAGCDKQLLWPVSVTPLSAKLESVCDISIQMLSKNRWKMRLFPLVSKISLDSAEVMTRVLQQRIEEVIWKCK